MVLLDLLGRRSALRVLWELREEGIPTFREPPGAMRSARRRGQPERHVSRRSPRGRFT